MLCLTSLRVFKGSEANWSSRPRINCSDSFNAFLNFNLSIRYSFILDVTDVTGDNLSTYMLSPFKHIL